MNISNIHDSTLWICITYLWEFYYYATEKIFALCFVVKSWRGREIIMLHMSCCGIMYHSKCIGKTIMIVKDRQNHIMCATNVSQQNRRILWSDRNECFKTFANTVELWFVIIPYTQFIHFCSHVMFWLWISNFCGADIFYMPCEMLSNMLCLMIMVNFLVYISAN